MYLSGLGKTLMACTREHRNEPWGSIMKENF